MLNTTFLSKSFEQNRMQCDTKHIIYIFLNIKIAVMRNHIFFEVIDEHCHSKVEIG